MNDNFRTVRRREVKDGVKLRSQEGDVGESWWAEKWIAMIESFGWKSRLERGVDYARSGQVMEYEIRPGQIQAKVQGSRRKPYLVRIQVRRLDDGMWNKVVRALSTRAVFTAKLLAGEMPREIEEAFRSVRASLFPVSQREIRMSCTCPDVANTCKHVAALYYIVGEAFDRDPWLMFELRGRKRDQLLSQLRGGRGPAKQAPRDQVRPLDPANFWTPPPQVEIRVAPPGAPMAVLRRLGAPAFWTGSSDFFGEMAKTYFLASQRAINLAYSLG